MTSQLSAMGDWIWCGLRYHVLTGVSEPMSRAKEMAEVTSRDQKRYARARVRGEALRKDLSAVVSARYEKTRDRVELMFGGGGWISIPRTMIPGLANASTSRLAAIEVSPARNALSWRSLDADVYVPELVERAFGNRLFAAPTDRPRRTAKVERKSEE